MSLKLAETAIGQRVASIRDRALRSVREPDTWTEEMRAESLKQSEGETAVVREAMWRAHYYRRCPLVVHPGELIVGDYPRTETKDVQTPEIFGRQGWKGGRSWQVPDNLEIFFKSGMLSWAGNHKTLDYDTVFSVGLKGLRQQIAARIERLDSREPDYGERKDFLRALDIVADGYVDLSNRYADYLIDLAEDEPEPSRAEELRSIAANCRRVPEYPPTNFWEACQCAWFSFFLVPDAPGRLDQYLYPFYEPDIQSGAINRKFAKELLACLWVKYFESVGPQSGVSAHNHLTLGGVTADGESAANEVTRMCLEVTEELRLLRPQIGLRCCPDTPPDILEQAIRVLRAKTGSPDFCNDEQIVPALVNAGVSLGDARNFSLSGCHEVIVTGMAQMGSVEGFVNMAKMTRMVLGLEPGLMVKSGLSDISGFDVFWNRITDAMEIVADSSHRVSLARDRYFAEMPEGHLETSLVTRDCIENAKGYTEGGARYNFCNWDIIGTSNFADSLVAIRTLVFEEKVLTLEQFANILETDWEGYEQLRQRVINNLPHFGNDDESDQIAARVIAAFSDILKRRTPYRGGEYILGTTAGGENMHVEFGRKTGATPDGRKAGTPLADSVGPAQGRDRSGLTAMLNSVSKLPHKLLPTATTLNVQLDPKLLDSEEGIRKTAALLRSHFASGGQQMQFNFYDRETLLEAKRHPERFSNLMVRVAGYSAPFVSLWDDLQDEVIARTQHRP